LTATGAISAVEMSASSVRELIQRTADTVMPELDSKFGASTASSDDESSGEQDASNNTAAIEIVRMASLRGEVYVKYTFGS